MTKDEFLLKLRLKNKPLEFPMEQKMEQIERMMEEKGSMLVASKVKSMFSIIFERELEWNEVNEFYISSGILVRRRDGRVCQSDLSSFGKKLKIIGLLRVLSGKYGDFLVLSKIGFKVLFNKIMIQKNLDYKFDVSNGYDDIMEKAVFLKSVYEEKFEKINKSDYTNDRYFTILDLMKIL